MIRTPRWAAAVAVMALGLGCTTSTSVQEFQIQTSVAPGADFSSLATYRWQTGTLRGAVVGGAGVPAAPVSEIRSALERELGARGFRRVETGPVDFWVAFRFAMSSAPVPGSAREGSSVMDPRPVGSSYSRSAGLAVSIGRPGAQEAAWTGLASGGGAGFLRRTEQIAVVVRRLLAEFPPL